MADGERSRVLPTRNHLYLFSVMLVVEAARLVGSSWVLDRLAHGLAHLAHRVSGAKRRRMERSLDHAFGPLPPAERTRIVRGAFFTFWDDTLSLVPWRAAAGRGPAISGLAHLDAALAAGKGVVLWESGYFGRRHIAKQALQRHGFRIHQVHDEAHRAGFGDRQPGWLRDRVVLAYFAARERAFTEEVLTFSRATAIAFTRTLRTVLARNQIVCITADVAMGERLLALPLLGEPKHFATGMVNLAHACGATLLPLFCIRADDGGIQVIIEPAIPVPSAGNRETRVAAPLRQYAALLERHIRQHPEQYRSWHFPWWEPA